MTELRALIVDDERLARARIRKLLTSIPGVEVVAEADCVETAIEQIAVHAPDVIFLDIQMPGGDGFDLFERCEVTARVIFVTAYDEHAVRAFEVSALDYLLKPVEPERLARSIERLTDAAPANTSQSLPPGLTPDDRVFVRQRGGMRFVSVGNITHIAGAGDYSELYLSSEKSLLSAESLSVWEIRLASAGFVRIHRQTIINLAVLEKLERRGGVYHVRLSGIEHSLPVARRRVAELKAAIEEL
ncbi:MAG: response regulator transcription factor [Proteobacteria bacterium]|nr:response regulator transcription factor [Pseudomonadota bacterium]